MVSTGAALMGPSGFPPGAAAVTRERQFSTNQLCYSAPRSLHHTDSGPAVKREPGFFAAPAVEWNTDFWAEAVGANGPGTVEGTTMSHPCRRGFTLAEL